MPTQNTPLDFRFRTSPLATTLARGMGFMLVWFSFDFLRGWLSPSWAKLPYLIMGLPFGLFLLSYGAALLIGMCDVNIVDGQFRFRRLLAWKSVPLCAVSKVRLWPPGVYVRLNYSRERHALMFFPEDFKFQWYQRVTAVGFLREACKRNAEKSKPV